MEDRGFRRRSRSEHGRKRRRLCSYLAQFDVVTERGTIQLLEGTYQISEEILPPTFARNLTIQGYGSGRTLIRQTDADKNGFTFPDGLNARVVLREFLLQGAGSLTSYSGTGVGIYQPNDVGNDSFAIEIDGVWVYSFGGDGINLRRAFNSEFNNVHINYCGGNGIVAGGNTITARGCYIHRLPESGSVGYKFLSGSATLISCNGVDDCDVWGQFGSSTLDDDDDESRKLRERRRRCHRRCSGGAILPKRLNCHGSDDMTCLATQRHAREVPHDGDGPAPSTF